MVTVIVISSNRECDYVKIEYVNFQGSEVFFFLGTASVLMTGNT